MSSSSSSSSLSSFPLTVSTTLEHKVKETHNHNDSKVIKTEIICKKYNDKILIIVSQGDVIGTMMEGFMEAHSDGSMTFSSVTLIGKRDDPLQQLYLKQLVEVFNKSNKIPVLLGINLLYEGSDVFQSVISFIKQACSTW